MPRYARSRPLPPAVQQLAEALRANEARLAVILDLLEHPDSTRTEIGERTDVPAHTVYQHLQALEQLDLATADVDAAVRHGRTVRYQINRDKLLRLLDAFSDQIRPNG